MGRPGARTTFSSRASSSSGLLAVLRLEEKSDASGGAFREELPERAQLEERHRRVRRELLLRLRPERDETRVVVREVGEVGGGGGVHERGPERSLQDTGFVTAGHRGRTDLIPSPNIG